MIGRTPIIEIFYKYKNQIRKIYAKLEFYNPTGSIKDRIAYHIITKSKKRGLLKKGQPIIEATSGNTGIAFCALGKRFGHPVEIFMPDWMSKERILIMQSFGANVHLVSSEEGGFEGSICKADKLASNICGFRPNQFSNEDNTEAHYLTTGPEIWNQLQSLGLSTDAFVAGVGTGGTVMGVGQYIKKKNPKAKIHPLEPSNSPTLSTGYKVGTHRIQGISDEFIPPILRLNELEEIISVDDGDSIVMAQNLAKILGLGIGLSSGANFLGAVKLQNIYGSNCVVSTVFSDDNKKYLTTDYVKEEPVKDYFLTPHIELIKYKIHICCYNINNKFE